MSDRQTGTVKWFNDAKGFGFITPETETVNAAIEGLPEELRTAIVLREIEGMSYEDIAQSMDCPIGTVRSRIFRAREAIATKLRPLLDTDVERRW